MTGVAANDDVWTVRRSMIDGLLEELRRQTEATKDPHPVELIETHVSWILLGREVYKIKKPVVLPFLDFSTFEAREAACRAEVRINRRLAPRTYLGVVPVRRRSSGAYTFASGGPIVEWAVRMRRLDDAQRADLLLERDALATKQIDQLAQRVAAFHAESQSTPKLARSGLPEQIERHALDNFTALGRVPSEVVPAEVLSEIERTQIAFLRGQRSILERRMLDGAIRDGHGDLRLEHVFFQTGGSEVEIIDGIEFDDQYRIADVCADVAFLAMDLARLGHVDLAEHFVATYARAANDYDLYGVLDFYESYRACVRAKIAAAALSDDHATEATRSRAALDVRRYLLLAQSARRRPALSPSFVAVAGGIATGKSTLAERLARDLAAPIVSADRTRKHMLGIEASQHATAGAWRGAYDQAFSERVYAEVLRRAGVVLASGRSVIVDASFRTVAARAAAREIASRHGVPFRLVECVAPIELCRKRVAERRGDVSDATPEILEAFADAFEPITELPPTELLRVDTSGATGDPLTSVERIVDTWPRGFVQ